MTGIRLVLFGAAAFFWLLFWVSDGWSDSMLGLAMVASVWWGLSLLVPGGDERRPPHPM